MAHAAADDLQDLELLLEQIRVIPSLKEKSMGCFYYKSKGVLHFHTKDGRRYAHVSDGKKWNEIDLPSPISVTAQKKAFKAIKDLLAIS
jgi:hypothetical protein